MQTINVPLTLKAASSKRKIEGHGSVFGNVDLGGDVVARGAFSGSLEEHKAAGSLPQMFWMHRPDKVPGKWDDMREDERGLAVKGRLAPTTLGDEMHTLLKMEAVRGLSIGFYTRDADYNDDGVRVIKAVDLVEVSLVSLAMNPLAQVESVKARLSAAGEYVPTPREFEHSLRDVGLSQSVAKKLVSAAFGKQRDVSGIESEGVAEVLATLKRATTEIEVATIRNLTRLY